MHSFVRSFLLSFITAASRTNQITVITRSSLWSSITTWSFHNQWLQYIIKDILWTKSKLSLFSDYLYKAEQNFQWFSDMWLRSVINYKIQYRTLSIELQIQCKHQSNLHVKWFSWIIWIGMNLEFYWTIVKSTTEWQPPVNTANSLNRCFSRDGPQTYFTNKTNRSTQATRDQVGQATKWSLRDRIPIRFTKSCGTLRSVDW